MTVPTKFSFLYAVRRAYYKLIKTNQQLCTKTHKVVFQCEYNFVDFCEYLLVSSNQILFV
jgi:hypothetical protein